jgi:hypothetical protein
MAGMPPEILKWRRWLKRIEQDQLQDLLLNQHLFHQFGEHIAHHVGSTEHAEFAEWIIEAHIAFAATAIRRVTEKPQSRWDSISLRILLEDMAKHDSLLTRERFEAMYRKPTTEKFAVRDFDRVAGKRGAPRVESGRILKDIHRLEVTCEPVNRLVNKIVAHTEEDRRKIGRLSYGDLDKAISKIVNVYQRYALLLTGRVCEPLVPLDGYDISDSLNLLWPKS